MKSFLLIGALFLGLPSLCIAQTTAESTSHNEDKLTASTYKTPVYPGCDSKLTNNELRKCMHRKILEFVENNFDHSIGASLNLELNTVKINTIFKIDALGFVTKARARAPHPALEKEAVRVLNLLPKMDQPGYEKGHPVIMPYSLPIIVTIDKPDGRASFPVYRGCSQKTNQDDLRACTTEKIIDYIKVRLNYELLDKAFPQATKTHFMVSFVINEKGKTEDIEVKANHRAVAIDIIQILKYLPRFKKPGYRHGKPVKTPVSFKFSVRL